MREVSGNIPEHSGNAFIYKVKKSKVKKLFLIIFLFLGEASSGLPHRCFREKVKFFAVGGWNCVVTLRCQTCKTHATTNKDFCYEEE